VHDLNADYQAKLHSSGTAINPGSNDFIHNSGNKPGFTEYSVTPDETTP
jgi:hypothetical protein